MIVIYDNDPDGCCAAFCVAKAIKEKIYKVNESRISFMAGDYGKSFPFQKVIPGETVVILDFSIPPEDMAKLFEMGCIVIWCDHHISAIEQYKDLLNSIGGIQDTNYCSAALAFKYFFNIDTLPDFVALVDDFDRWVWQYKAKTWHFILGIQTVDLNPITGDWENIIKDISPYIEKGKVVDAYQRRFFKENHENLFMTEFEGQPTLVANTHGRGNFVFLGHPDYDKAVIRMIYYRTGDKFKFSIFSSKVDVSKIATKYGGGGHPGAAGFMSDKVPF